MTQARKFIICPPILQRQFVVYKNKERHPTMKLYCQIECGESNRNRFLDSINTAEGPSPVILDRLLTKLFPFFFPCKHTIVSAITPAIPVFPFQIKWFLKVPATIRNVPISSELAVLKALASNTSSLLTVLHTVPVKRIGIAFASFEGGSNAEENRQERNPTKNRHIHTQFRAAEEREQGDTEERETER